MAIQVSGTTVIDNSKHLTNISGYSGHQAGQYIRYATGHPALMKTFFRVANLSIGRARIILSGYSANYYDSFYGVYDIFGNTTTNNYLYFKAKEVVRVVGDATVNTNTYIIIGSNYVDVVGYGGFQYTTQYNYAWDFYYNIGNHTSIPTLTIINN